MKHKPTQNLHRNRRFMWKHPLEESSLNVCVFLLK